MSTKEICVFRTLRSKRPRRHNSRAAPVQRDRRPVCVSVRNSEKKVPEIKFAISLIWWSSCCSQVEIANSVLRGVVVAEGAFGREWLVLLGDGRPCSMITHLFPVKRLDSLTVCLSRACLGMMRLPLIGKNGSKIGVNSL